MPSDSLYQIEEGLRAFLDTQDLVPPELQEAFEKDLAAQLKTAVEKRQRVGEFIRFCELQSDAAKAEIARLSARKQRFDATVERLSEYVRRVIESMGSNPQGAYPKLEGRTVTFSLRNCPPSVVITDEAAVPGEFKIVTEATSIDKIAIRKAIQGDAKAGIPGRDIPGADLLIGKTILEIT